MKLLRRNFLQLVAGAAALPAASHFAWAQVSPMTSQCVRVATGLLATWQSTAWLGAEAGLFKKRGIEMSLPAIAVGGPEAAAGLIRGDWEFAHTGTVPVAEEVLKGRDIVILATPTSDFPKSFVMTRKEITQLAQLGGKKVGVLTETGQTSVAARITVEKAGATATYLPLIKFDRIYAALAAGEIDAGALPIDLRFTGQARYGWNAFPIDAFDTPSISDINMPGMSGLELLPKAKAMRPDVPIIMITAYGDAETKRKALESGAEALLTKPIDFGMLRSEIDMRVERAV